MKKIGLDVVKVSRIDKLKNNQKFIDKIFDSEEVKYLEKKRFNSETVAGFFACKEAVAKAVGTGIGKTSWKNIKIRHDENGAPYGILNNSESEIIYVNLSITHEKEYALAVALIEENINFNLKNPPIFISKRKEESHKGTYGKVSIIGGSFGMSGSIYLASTASLRMGSGLVYSVVPSSIAEILSIKFEEVIVESIASQKPYFDNNADEILKKIEKSDAIALGPGLGWDESRETLVKKVIQRVKKPVVLDADGLNCISDKPDVLKKGEDIVITPHPGEMSRLTKKTISEILKNPKEIATDFAKKYNVVVVLKKSNTVVVNPKGDYYINKTGNPGMATAGSGDVLTGIIVSLIGQGYGSFDASKLGVFIHGLAGDMAAKKYGQESLIAKDIIEFMPEAIKKCKN